MLMMGRNKKDGMYQRRKRCCSKSYNRAIAILGLLTIHLFGTSYSHSINATVEIEESVKSEEIGRLDEVTSKNSFKRSVDLQNIDSNEYNIDIDKPKNDYESDELSVQSLSESELENRPRRSSQKLHRYPDGETYYLEVYKYAPARLTLITSTQLQKAFLPKSAKLRNPPKFDDPKNTKGT